MLERKKEIITSLERETSILHFNFPQRKKESIVPVIG
jgi:hypothetical protein